MGLFNLFNRLMGDQWRYQHDPLGSLAGSLMARGTGR